jgi:hypothetical protein
MTVSTRATLSLVIACEGGRSSIPAAAVIEPRGRGVLDTPLEPVIGLAEGETRWRGITVEGGAVAFARNDVKLLRRGTDRRTAGWPMQEGDRDKRAQP